MQQSLENHACIIKGFILSVTVPTVPPAVMRSLNILIDGLQTRIPRAPAPVDESIAAYDALRRDAAALDSTAARAQSPNEDAHSRLSVDIANDDDMDAASTAPPCAAMPDAIKKRSRKPRLSKETDLEEVQRRHDAGESNGAIAGDHDVSDQTIINFLKAHGRYEPKQRAGRHPKAAAVTKSPETPLPSPAPLYPAREDALGEPMTIGAAAAPAPRAPAMPAAYASKSGWDKYDGRIQPGDLIDVHDMLAEGKTLDDIAAHYHTNKENIADFILTNQNAQFTRIKYTKPQPYNAATKEPPPTVPTKRRKKKTCPLI